MELFILMEISSLLLMISAFVNSEMTSTRTFNINGTGEGDHSLAFCDPQTNSCKNGGKCIQEEDSYKCSCLERTSGDFCELIEECKDPKFCGDRLRAKCYFNITKERADCVCYDEKKAFDPAKKVCKRICGVNNNECENGGICVKNGNSSYCKCMDGTRGDLCEIVDECENHLCGHEINQECYFDELEGKAACKCIEEDSVFYEEEKQCRKVCSTKNPCRNGGVCVNIGNYSFCSCLDGTFGDLCKYVEDCGFNTCGKDGRSSCYFDVENRKAACKCVNEDEIYDNERRVCKKKSSPCSSNPCKNGGSCNDETGTAVCKCIGTFSGIFCETDGCSYHNCMNGGLCREINNRIQCYCLSPFTGEFCENDPCTPNPCVNGGTCRIQNDKFRCDCNKHFSGDFCEKGSSDIRYILILAALSLLIVMFIVLVICLACRRRGMSKV